MFSGEVLIKRVKRAWGSIVNRKNRKRLVNTDVTIISSNCAAGIFYHYLGLKFWSPFIDLGFSNEDFVKVLENLDKFLDTPIVECLNPPEGFPIGIGYDNIRVRFRHYKTFDEAIRLWNKRKTRINFDNLAVMFCNYFGGNDELLERFDKLPFKHKVVFVDKPYPDIKSAFYLEGWHPIRNGKWFNVWRHRNYLTRSRYIDQFDYVQFFNECRESEL